MTSIRGAGVIDGFKKFLLRGNLVELAVAVVIGAAFGALVRDFVTAFITPLIALLGGQPDFAALEFTVNGTRFPYGIFLTSIISFLIIAAVVYLFVMAPISKAIDRLNREEEQSERPCPHCLGDIPAKATRCMFCTAELQPAV